MNPSQQMFHDFYMDMVIEGKRAEAEKLLEEGFKKQDEGSFNLEYFKSAEQKYYDLIKLESKEKLKRAMTQFISKL